MSAPLDPSPLLAGPSGPITCTDCGATLPSGTRPGDHAPGCPTAARWRAYEVLGGSPARLSRQLYQEAGGAETARAVAGVLREVAAGVEARAGRAPGPLRVYVAGGAAERGACGTWIARLRGAGVEVTHDWTVDPGWNDPAPSPVGLAAAAAADLDGVRRCDVLWLLCPAEKSEGSACELGAALALGRRVVASGPWDAVGRIFPGLAGVRCGTHEEGFAAVCEMVAR